MKVIWKRPDGFHGATPQDFTVVNISGLAHLWLHHRDVETFPFRVSGGWEEEAQTAKLNRLINLLRHSADTWDQYLHKSLSNSMTETAKDYCHELVRWLKSDIRPALKGDTWELEIMQAVIDLVVLRIEDSEPRLAASSGNG